MTAPCGGNPKGGDAVAAPSRSDEHAVTAEGGQAPKATRNSPTPSPESVVERVTAFLSRDISVSRLLRDSAKRRGVDTKAMAHDSLVKEVEDLLADTTAFFLSQQDRIGRLEEALTNVLDTSGVRGEYHALKHWNAVVAAESTLSQDTLDAVDREGRDG